MTERKSSRRKKIDRPASNPIEKTNNEPTQATIDEKRQIYPASTVSIHWDALNTKRKISSDLKNEIADLYYDLQKKPSNYINRLTELCEDYSDVLIFQGFLMMAYHLEELDDKLLQLTESLQKKYNDYIFGKIAFIESALSKNDVDSITKYLNNKYSYTDLFPQKGVFHIFEVVYFSYSVGRYFVAAGEAKKAESYLEQIKFIDPEHVFIKKLQKEIDKGSDLKFYQKVLRKFKRS
jgi:hypothetical protein